MPYLTTQLWKLPDSTLDRDSSQRTTLAQLEQTMLASVCRDCRNYNFTHRPNCRFCGSLRVQMVSVPQDSQPHPRAWRFSGRQKPPKPN